MSSRAMNAFGIEVKARERGGGSYVSRGARMFIAGGERDVSAG